MRLRTLRLSRLHWALTMAFGLSLLAALYLRYGTPARAQTADVDLALVLAIDCSFSVDTTEFRLQMQGLGQALRRKEIHDAIAQGTTGRIAVSVFQWSDDRSQLIVVPWTIVDGSASANALADKLETMPRKLAEGGTSISSAMRFAAAMLEAGRVYINAWGVGDPAAPFGGFKASGIGREKGHANLDAYLELKTVFTKL